MKEFNLSNCYKLYNEKFGESVQEQLEKTIRDSQAEIEKKLEVFLQTNLKDPLPAESLNDREDTQAKRILSEIIKSKNYLLSLLDSPYLHLYIKYRENVSELARWITWHWLASPKPKFSMPDPFKYGKLKEMLVSIGYHSSIYYFNDYFSSYIEESDPAIYWPKKEQLEMYRINELDKKFNQQKQLLEETENNYNEFSTKQEKIIISLNEELDQKKEQLSLIRAKLELLEEHYFFMEDSLFKDYVFEDLLPELKSVYELLKEFKVYNSNWGYFCYCLTQNNYSSPEPLKLKLSLRGSNFDTKDLGYVFNLLQNEFYSHSKTDYIQWLSKIVEIESGRGNPQDISDFYRKHIRPYKKGKTGPAFYDEITEKLHFFSMTLD